MSLQFDRCAMIAKKLLVAIVALIATANGCFLDSSCARGGTSNAAICCWTCSAKAFECWYTADGASAIENKMLKTMDNKTADHFMLERSILADLGWNLGIKTLPGRKTPEGNFATRRSKLVNAIREMDQDSQQYQAMLRVINARLPDTRTNFGNSY